MSGSIRNARGYSFDLIQTQNSTAWGKSIKKETKLVIEEKTNTLQWPDDTSGIWIAINPNFPVKITENKLYSFTDYIEAIGG